MVAVKLAKRRGLAPVKENVKGKPTVLRKAFVAAALFGNSADHDGPSIRLLDSSHQGIVR